mgnify:CR=1 FL=1
MSNSRKLGELISSNGAIQNDSIWINNGTESGNYNENVRLFDPQLNSPSVIGFGASGTSGTPRHSILSYNSDTYGLDFRVGNISKLKLRENSFDVINDLTVGDGTHTLTVSPHTVGIDIHSTGNVSPHYQTEFSLFTGEVGSGTERLSIDNSGYLTLPGSMEVGGTITGGVPDLTGDGSTNVPFLLSADYNSWMMKVTPTSNWGLFWAGNSGAAYGTNGAGGPGNIFGNSSNPNEFAFVSSLGTIWSVHGATGNTWQKGSAYIDGDIRFSRGASDYSNYIRAANYPSQGYTTTTSKYWIEYGSRGGQHFVLNTDGGAGSGENTMDDFIIWQGAIDGDRLLSCSNTGNVDAAGKITSQGFTVATFRTADNTYQVTLGASGETSVASGLPGDCVIFGCVHLITTDVDQSDHFDVTIGEVNTNSTTWAGSTGSYPNALPPNGTTTVSHLGDSQGVLQGHYGAWTPIAFRVTSSGDIKISVVGNNASARVSIKVMGYITR